MNIMSHSKGMKSAFAIALFLIILSVLSLSAEKAKIPVIVDTDAALDDMRAVILLSQSDKFEIHALVTSDGACSPKIGAENMLRLLQFMGKGEVAVGYGSDLDKPAPPWRSFTESIWNTPADSFNAKMIGNANDVLSHELNPKGSKYIYLCLGPMTNLAYFLDHDKKAKQEISAIYYRGTDPYVPEPSWNTARDKKAVERVLQSKIPIYFFETSDSEEIVFDSAMLAKVESMNTTASKLLCLLHSEEPVSKLVNSGHFGAWDESLILSLIYPELTQFNQSDTAKYIHTNTGFDKQAGYVKYLELINKEDTSR